MCLVKDINELKSDIVGSESNFNYIFEHINSIGSEKYSLIFSFHDLPLFRDQLQQLEGWIGDSLYSDIINQFNSPDRKVNFTGIILERSIDRYKPSNIIDEWRALKFGGSFDLVKDSVFNIPGDKIYYISLDWESLIDNINSCTKYELLGK